MLQFNNLWKIGKIAFHREDTVNNNQFNSILWQSLQHTLQVFHIIVLVVELTSKRQTATIYDRSMVTVVADDIITLTDNHCQHALIYRETCRKAQAVVLTNKLRNFFF